VSQDRSPRGLTSRQGRTIYGKEWSHGFSGFKQVAQMSNFLQTLWSNQRGQDIAEYAVILAVILVLVVGTVRLVGSNANNVFSSVASAVH
jgi:Flp pilus assembly pilin Flp